MRVREEEMPREFSASADQYTKFISGNAIWNDLKMVVEQWRQGCLDALASPEQTNTLEAVADFQGRIYMCEKFLSFPETAMEVIKAEEKE